MTRPSASTRREQYCHQPDYVARDQAVDQVDGYLLVHQLTCARRDLHLTEGRRRERYRDRPVAEFPLMPAMIGIRQRLRSPRASRSSPRRARSTRAAMKAVMTSTASHAECFFERRPDRGEVRLSPRADPAARGGLPRALRRTESRISFMVHAELDGKLVVGVDDLRLDQVIALERVRGLVRPSRCCSSSTRAASITSAMPRSGSSTSSSPTGSTPRQPLLIDRREKPNGSARAARRSARTQRRTTFQLSYAAGARPRPRSSSAGPATMSSRRRSRRAAALAPRGAANGQGPFDPILRLVCG